MYDTSSYTNIVHVTNPEFSSICLVWEYLSAYCNVSMFFLLSAQVNLTMIDTFYFDYGVHGMKRGSLSLLQKRVTPTLRPRGTLVSSSSLSGILHNCRDLGVMLPYLYIL